MIPRRSLLKAAGSSPLILAGLAGASTEVAAPSMPRAVVVDSRHPASLAFAAVLPQVPVLRTDGDPTLLWRHHLLPLWRGLGANAVIAGLTSVPMLFCLDQMARDHGLRAVAHAGLGEITGRALWPLPDVPDSSRWTSAIEAALQLQRPALQPDAEPLVAWVIAPTRAF